MGIIKFDLSAKNNYSVNLDGYSKMQSNFMNSFFAFNSSNKSKNYFESFKTNYSNYDLSNYSKRNRSESGDKNIVDTAAQYVGYKESDGSFKTFTGGKNHAWCADFVSYVVKESCENNGRKVPFNFGSSSVEGLRQWGKNNDSYFDTTSVANKSVFIANNVKPGDIVIFKENGRSHTGIVKDVDKDGNISTIEGNTSDKVGYRKYSANEKTLSGFVQVA